MEILILKKGDGLIYKDERQEFFVNRSEIDDFILALIEKILKENYKVGIVITTEKDEQEN
jgi:CRISPR/Cas system CMR-associated protein Cmr3 (group 5 of RAMP superfamily)